MVSKRSHSQHSPAPQSSPVPQHSDAKAFRIGPPIPVFLRQPRAEINAKFRELNWQEKIRIAQGRSDPDSKWAQDGSLPVVQRNRYAGVQPWDKSRIRLQVSDGRSDYINASPILLKEPRTGVETRYIATQGPKKNVLSHFWQMIWHETIEVAVIVMLTPTEESGREKCFQYFPLDAQASPFKFQFENDEGQFREGAISYIETVPALGKNTIIRKFNFMFEHSSKTVWHLLFTAFPDFGVPEDDDRIELLDIIKMSSDMNSTSDNPRIIHCSAGVGRSGTFIALDHLLSQLHSGAVADAEDAEDFVYDVVHKLREQRMMMVQMENQFVFLYDVLREELEKQLATSSMAGPPSPKLRKLANGVRDSLMSEPARTAMPSGEEAVANESRMHASEGICGSMEAHAHEADEASADER